MTARTLVVLLAFWTTAAQAVPLTFTSTQYQVGALAIAGAAFDSNADSNPPTAFPLLTSAFTSSGANSADAAAAADAGFLGAAASAFSVDEISSGLGSAEFTGNFIAPGGKIHIALDFDSQATSAGGTADNTLLVHLTANGMDFLNAMFSASGLINLFADLPAGAIGILDILLTSSADADNAQAFALSSASFTASVPVVPTFALLLPGLVYLGMRGRRA